MAVVVHISGPPASGKTTLSRILAARRGTRAPPHYVRCFLKDDAGASALRLWKPEEEMASERRCGCTAERIFEELHGEISACLADGAGEWVIVETGTDPCFRHAYPYDVKVFVMSCPASTSEVFRTPSETLDAMERALEDSTHFASELFGMSADDAASGSSAGPTMKPAEGDADLESFIESGVGMEIASRLQLHEHFQGVLDSDVIIFNEAIGQYDPDVAACSRRVQAVLTNMGRMIGRKPALFACEPLQVADPLGRKCVEYIESLIVAAYKARP